jgi:hypothetical protein
VLRGEDLGTVGPVLHVHNPILAQLVNLSLAEQPVHSFYLGHL